MNPEKAIGEIVGVAVLLGIGLTFLFYLAGALTGNAANAVNQIAAIIGNSTYLAIIGLVFIVVLLAWAWRAYKGSGIVKTGK